MRGSNVLLGGQDMFWEKEGAYTGAVSAHMLKAVGCSHVIIGHSERREYRDDVRDEERRSALFCVATEKHRRCRHIRV